MLISLEKYTRAVKVVWKATSVCELDFLLFNLLGGMELTGYLHRSKKLLLPQSLWGRKSKSTRVLSYAPRMFRSMSTFTHPPLPTPSKVGSMPFYYSWSAYMD